MSKSTKPKPKLTRCFKDKDTQSKSKSSTCLATQSKQEQLNKHKIYKNVNTRLVIWRKQTTDKSQQSWHDDFYPEVHLVATKLVPVETSSKIAADPLASGDSQVTLSHVECSHEL